jgi:hypothetical protein
LRAHHLKSNIPQKQPNKSFKLAHLPLDLQVQARELFFAYYIKDFSRNWDFLFPYFDSGFTPDHLSLSIDAVSLAFLSHHFISPSAQNLGCKKYVSALRKTNLALENTDIAREASTLDASLLLDLFEKLTKPAFASDETQRAHIDGALALVKLRGLENFTDIAGLRTLNRLSLNALICAISQQQSIPPEVFEVREHLAHFFDTEDPKFRSTGLTLEVTNLVSEIRSGNLSPQEKVRRCTELDKQFKQISLHASPYWSYERVHVSAEERNERMLDGFYDVYNERMTTQMWNALRVTRILLCEEVMEASSALQDDESLQHIQRAAEVIDLTIQEICASVPQMTDWYANPKTTHNIAPFDSFGSTLLTLYSDSQYRCCKT